jgi:signal transduction histidine kinase
MRHLSLRARFVWGILFCVGLTLLLLACWSIWASQRIEQGLLNDVMRTHLAIYAGYIERHQSPIPPQGGQLAFFRSSSPDIPRELAALGPGCHQRVPVAGKLLQVLVKDLPGSGRVYVTFDVTEHERRALWAWRLLYAIIAVTLIVMAATAIWVSRSILAPVTSLAQRLQHIDPRRRNQRLGPDHSQHELAPIADSIDGFLERLDGFVEREQSFTATASHELRTPLAVIQGAAEILTDHTRERPAAHKALSRIRRAANEMSDFTQALLMLSREAQLETDPGEMCDVGEIMPGIADEQRELLNGRPVQIECACGNPLRVQAPPSLVTIVVGNLFRNAIAHTDRGTVQCEVDGRTLRIRDSGAGISPAHINQVFDRNFTTRPGGYGVGLYLTKRICDRYGWKIALESSPAGTIASVTF